MSKTAVFLADPHHDYTDEIHPAWTVAKKFTADMKPDEIILGGDYLEMTPFSPWLKKKNQQLLLEGVRWEDEKNKGLDELARLRYLCKDSKITLMEGNHEVWMWQYVEQNPQLEGYLDYRKDLRLEEMDVEWIPENEVYTVGKMNFIHGWYHNIYFVRQTLQDMGDHVICGHMHKHQAMVLKMRPNRQPHMGMGVGCLCSKNPARNRNRPTDYLNSFAYVEFDSDGNFQAHHLVIVDGAVMFAGHTWRA